MRSLRPDIPQYVDTPLLGFLVVILSFLALLALLCISVVVIRFILR